MKLYDNINLLSIKYKYKYNFNYIYNYIIISFVMLIFYSIIIKLNYVIFKINVFYLIKILLIII